MSSWWYLVDISKSRDELSSLLPHIAGIIESVDEASFHDIKEQVEKELEKSVPEREVMKALENGIRLGLFTAQREFKVCREFTTKEIKRSRGYEQNKSYEVFDGISGKPPADTSLMKFVKNQREERRNKIHKKRRKTVPSFSSKYIKGNIHLYKYLCDKCKKSVEREIVDLHNSSSYSSEEENERDSAAASAASLDTSISSNSCIGIKFSGEMEKPPEKSRLLVEKNPMETDPPYYDIFT